MSLIIFLLEMWFRTQNLVTKITKNNNNVFNKIAINLKVDIIQERAVNYKC